MSKTATKTAQFLRAMQPDSDPPVPSNADISPSLNASPTVEVVLKTKSRRAKAAKSRDELKHFGGYLDDETLEKIALLRIRLKLDNSGLIKRAIDDLARKHSAAKAFGDV